MSRAGRLLEALSRTVRIARWEVAKSAGTVDRKTVIALVVLALAVGTIGVTAVDDGIGFEEEIYVVGIEGEDNPYIEVVEEDDRFSVVETTGADFLAEETNADLYLGPENHVEYRDTPTGQATYDAFRDAVEGYNDRLMQAEPDGAAAYPVYVSVQYQNRDLSDDLEADDETGTTVSGEGDSTDGSGDGDPADGSDDSDSADDSEDDSDPDEGFQDDGASVDGPEDGGGGEGDGDSRFGVPDLGGGTLEDGGPQRPGQLSPPFPFQSLVLAFLFVVPMNFVIQAYGSTIMAERIKRRGELLLVSPVSRGEIVAGKTLPYLLGALGIVVAIALAIGGGILSVAAAVPIALLFLASTFAGAMFARSFKELTFVTVTISVGLTTYVFVPAVFTDVTPIALISPLSLVVMDLQGTPVGVGEYLFSTAAFYLISAALFVLGLSVYREEDMFTQKTIPSKLIDAIATRVTGYRSVPILSILAIPFVFAGQLLAIALLFAVPESIALPVIFVLAAAIEEVAKSLHVYAGFARSKFESSLGVAALVGTLSGVGFFLGEKVTHAVQFVGIPDLAVGQAAFGPEISSDPLVLVAIFFAPMVLHVVTAVISALGASRGRHLYALAVVLATAVHAVYNLGVIALVA